MPEFFYIALGLASFGFFVVQFRRAFFSNRQTISENWFATLDVSLGVLVSVLLACLALQTFTAPERPFTEKDLGGGLLTQAVLGGLVIAYVAFRKIPLKDFFGVGRMPFWRQLALAAFLLLGIFPMVSIVANYLNQGASEEQQVVKFFRETHSMQGRLLVAFMAVVVAPTVEELVFRGWLYRIFKGYFGKLAAMFVVSVLFAAIHGNIPTLIPLTLLAFGLTIGLELSGSLIVSIAMHAIFNATSLIYMLVETAR